jgi:hypothetical protein
VALLEVFTRKCVDSARCQPQRQENFTDELGLDDEPQRQTVAFLVHPVDVVVVVVLKYTRVGRAITSKVLCFTMSDVISLGFSRDFFVASSNEFLHFFWYFLMAGLAKINLTR